MVVGSNPVAVTCINFCFINNFNQQNYPSISFWRMFVDIRTLFLFTTLLKVAFTAEQSWQNNGHSYLTSIIFVFQWYIFISHARKLSDL